MFNTMGRGWEGWKGGGREGGPRGGDTDGD